MFCRIYTPFHELSSDTGTKIWDALANSLILMTFIVLMTILLIFLYKKRCYKIIHGWLMLSSFMLLFIFSYLYLGWVSPHLFLFERDSHVIKMHFFRELLRAYNIPMDDITAFMIMWNFGVAGMMSIHWQGPLRLQQAYLIFVAALMALVFIKYLPEVTTWVVLAVISIWGKCLIKVRIVQPFIFLLSAFCRLDCCIVTKGTVTCIGWNCPRAQRANIPSTNLFV